MVVVINIHLLGAYDYNLFQGSTRKIHIYVQILNPFFLKFPGNFYHWCPVLKEFI